MVEGARCSLRLIYICLQGGVLPQRKQDAQTGSLSAPLSRKSSSDQELPPALANHDKMLVDKIEAEIMHQGPAVRFEDISGLEFAKQCVIETVCW